MNDPTKWPTGLPGTQEGPPFPTTTEIHRVLSSERRRITLRVLVNSEAPLALRELAVMVAEREAVEDSVGEEIDRVAIELHHNHLPRIAGVGLVQYDAESNHVDAIYQNLAEQILEGRF